VGDLPCRHPQTQRTTTGKESNTMKFMVSIALRPQDEEKILPLVAEEQARVQMLREQGVIEARYISADRVHVWLVVQRESQNQVQKDLESIPIYPYMEVAITPLDQI
jgi:muconolactone delta-isomerase